MSPGAAAGAQPGRELNGGTEEIVAVVGHRLARADPDADVERRSTRLGVPALHHRVAPRPRTRPRLSDRNERGHDAVTGVLDLTTVVYGELITNEPIVLAQHHHVAVIAELVGLGDRAAHVGEHDRPRGGHNGHAAGEMVRERAGEQLDAACPGEAR